MSDASSLLRVRNFLVLADAAAIALNVFRLRTDTLVSELGFDDRPHTDELFDGVLQGIAAPLEELNRVRDAVFTSDPRTVGLSFVSCLQDCYQSRGYTAERCEDPAYLATQTFVNLRGPIGPPGVNFGVVQEPDDGWNSWRAIYAADGKQLADYGRIRTQIIGLAGIHERDIISREQCFTLHPMCWPTRYTTSDLVRMAEESHRIVHDYPLTSVVPPASDVAVLELAPALPSPTHTEPALTDTPKGIPADEANVLVRDWLSANVKGDSGSITRDAVAAATGVSTGAVSKTAAWKAFRPRRDANSKPVLRTVPLTDAMLANIPADCDSEEIADLIKAQAEDAAADERQHPKKSRRHERRHGPS